MILGIIAIATVIIATLLVASGVIKEKYYPYCIGIMALGLVYSTTLLGNYVVGSDIQGELYQAKHTLADGLNFTDANSYSIVTILIAPLLSQLLRIDIIWVFKAVLPLFLAGVPVILYFAFKAQFGAKRAYFASLFFIIMPIYSLEIAQIVKSMVAEFFYALAILAMVSNWKRQWKFIMIAVCCVLTVIAHYTIGILLIGSLAGILVIRIATNWSKWKLFAIKKTELLTMAAVLLLCLLSFHAFYGYIAKGTLNRSVNIVATGLTDNTITVIEKQISQPAPAEKTMEYLNGQEYLVKTGIGMDFMAQPIQGKAFRIIQYLTQLLLIIGALFMLFNPARYGFTAEFVAGIGCNFALLAICIFIPAFSSMINMTRFYQASLFFLAPMIVVGTDAVSILLKWMVK